MSEGPLAIDLFCGLGGWARPLMDAGWHVVGFDIEQHVYGEHRYPAQLVIQDVLTLHGSQFRNADLILASPPCQFFSHTAMPWSKAKKLAAEVRADSVRLEAELALFRACFRIQDEASEAAGHHIPLIIENVRGAIPWVGRSRWNFGSFHFWGDVPALMPQTSPRKGVPRRTAGHWTNPAEREGIKHQESGHAWFRTGHGQLPSASPRRKMASALIAKIPEPLAAHIARVFKP